MSETLSDADESASTTGAGVEESIFFCVEKVWEVKKLKKKN